MPKSGDQKPVRWFCEKLERGQSNALLKQLKYQPLPPGIDPTKVLNACLKDYGVRDTQPRVTTVDEKMLLKLLGQGRLPDEGIRDVLIFGSAYTIMALNKKRPDLMPIEGVAEHIRGEARVLVDDYFVRKRRNDKRLSAFIRWLERVPGLAEVVVVHHVHAL